MLDVTLGQLLRQAALEVPDRIALVRKGVPTLRLVRRWTYAQLLTEAERVASALLGKFPTGPSEFAVPGGSQHSWMGNCFQLGR